MYIPYIYPFICCFCVLAFVNSAAVNIGVHVYFLNRIFFFWIYAQEWDCWIIW